MNKFDKRLGTILAKRGLVDQKQIDDALGRSESEKKSLTELLVAGGIESESQ